MNPNQPQQNFQPYSPQSKTNQYVPYQSPIQQNQYSQNTLNIPKNNYLQPGSLSPNEGSSFNRNKIDRAMYSSTIEPTLPSKNYTFGKLQSMGRFVPNNNEGQNINNKIFSEYSSSQNQPIQRNNLPQNNLKPFQYNASNNKINDFDRFPSFNLHDNNLSSQNVPNQYSQPQSLNQQNKPQIISETLTPQEKRRRQILAIKQQLDLINKKMESSNLNKKFPQQNQKNDPKPQQFIGNNNFLDPVNSYNQERLTPSNVDTNNQLGGISFSRNISQGLTVDRNKGMVAQSMIVSTQPSPGYKYQSIFDKYDSLKKPTYQTNLTPTDKSNQTPTNKQDTPLLLDKFLNKKPTISSTNQTNQTYTNNQINGNYTNNNTPSSNLYIQNPSTNNQSPHSITKNISSNYTSPTNNNSAYSFTSRSTNQSSYSFTSQSTNQNIQKNASQLPKQSTGMFKKKKANFNQQIQIQQIISNTLSNDNPSKVIKASDVNIVTKAMKQMNIQESLTFKKQDFIVGKKLGKGQFGQVMLVQHKKTGFLCGMKVMQKKQIRDQKYQGQIARQLSIQFYLAHRNIAPLYGYFQDQKNVYLLVQYCTGGQLLQLLRKNRRMEEPEVSRIIRQIIEGIDYIHKQLIIHRDIKPENILFNFGVAKICDFGWAVYKGHGMRKTASVGSPLYYSPQIVMGVQYDEKIDIWDIGMMTYECLLGKIPFRIYSQLDLNRIVEDQIKFPQYIDTSQQAKDFILRIMKKKPQERMQIRQMLRHPFITKYQDLKLPIQIMKDFKEVLSS